MGKTEHTITKHQQTITSTTSIQNPTQQQQNQDAAPQQQPTTAAKQRPKQQQQQTTTAKTTNISSSQRIGEEIFPGQRLRKHFSLRSFEGNIKESLTFFHKDPFLCLRRQD